MKKLNKKGFTLIELLAVIVILGILMLTAIPAVTRAIAKSRKNTFWQNAKQYIQAAQTQFLAGEYYNGGVVCSVPGDGHAYKILIKDITLDGGDATRSSFGAKYNSGNSCEPAVFVVNNGSGENVKLEWYFVGTDESKNGIDEFKKEKEIGFDVVKTGTAKTGVGTNNECTAPVPAANITTCTPQ